MRRSSTSASERPGRRSRIALKALACVAVLLAAELAVRALPAFPPVRVWGDPEQDLKARRMDELAGAGPVDVVAVGSSVADAGVDPGVMAARSSRIATGYNASLEGSSAGAMGAWLRGVVGPTLRPRVALVLLSPREMNDRGTNQHDFDVAFFGSRGWRAADGRRTVPDRLDELGETHSALVRSREWLRDPYEALRWVRTGQASSQDFPIDPDTGRLVRHDDAAYQGIDRAVISTSFARYTVGGRSVERLRRELAHVQRDGTEVVVVSPPHVTSELVDLLGAGAVERSDRAVERLAASVYAPFLDLRELVDTDGFGDPLHLNRSGSTQMSAELAERLGSLPARAWSPGADHGCP